MIKEVNELKGKEKRKDFYRGRRGEEREERSDIDKGRREAGRQGRKETGISKEVEVKALCTCPRGERGRRRGGRGVLTLLSFS